MSRPQVLGQVRVGGESRGVQAGRGRAAVLELADPQQGEPLVVVLRLIFALQKCRQVREDQRLGLAAEDVSDPGVVVVALAALQS